MKEKDENLLLDYARDEYNKVLKANKSNDDGDVWSPDRTIVALYFGIKQNAFTKEDVDQRLMKLDIDLGGDYQKSKLKDKIKNL